MIRFDLYFERMAMIAMQKTDLTEGKSRMPGNGLRKLLTVVQGRDHVNSDTLAPEKMKREGQIQQITGR